MEFSDEELLHTVKGNRYEFVLTSRKVENEFICQSSTLISTQGNKDKMTRPNYMNQLLVLVHKIMYQPILK